MLLHIEVSNMECPVGIKEFRTFHFWSASYQFPTLWAEKSKEVELIINFTPSMWSKNCDNRGIFKNERGNLAFKRPPRLLRQKKWRQTLTTAMSIFPYLVSFCLRWTVRPATSNNSKRFALYVYRLSDSQNKYDEHLKGSRCTLKNGFSRPFLGFKSALDCKKVLTWTSGVTRPWSIGIISLCLMLGSWDMFDFVEKSHS